MLLQGQRLALSLKESEPCQKIKTNQSLLSIPWGKGHLSQHDHKLAWPGFMGAGSPQTPGLERKGFLLIAIVQPSVGIAIILSSPSSHEALTTELGDTCASSGLSQRNPEFREPRYSYNVQ